MALALHSAKTMNATQQTQQWQVIDGQTGAVVGTYSSARRAHNRVDKLDNAYGGYRYHVRALTAPVAPARCSFGMVGR